MIRPSGDAPGQDLRGTQDPGLMIAAVQPHGVLVSLDAETKTILQVSANCQLLIGLSPEQMLGQPVAEVLGPLAASRIEQEVRHTAWGGSSVSLPSFPNDMFELEAHRSGNTVVVELEPGDPPSEGNVATLYRSVRRAMAGMRLVADLDGLFELAVNEVQHLTGMDRVVVYRFDLDGHREVIAEARREGVASCLGQHFPASELPARSRAALLRNWLRQIVSVEHEPSPLVPSLDPRTGAPLAMHQCTLSTVSPELLQHLRNLGVESSTSISLIVEEQLWGFIACHHHSPKRLPRHIRVACELLGRLVSLEIQSRQAILDAQRAAQLDGVVHRISSSMLDEAGLGAGLRASGSLLLQVADADGAVAVVDGDRVEFGALPPPWLLEQIVAALLPEDGATPVHKQRLDDVPALAGVERSLLAQSCGALVAPVPHVANSYVAWFRREERKAVNWGGRPNEAPPEGGAPPTLTGRCRPWLPVEVSAARQLARAIPDLLLRQAQERLADHAMHDPLTGLPNRVLLLDRLEYLLHRRQVDQVDAALFIDLDRFKLVNDSRGHSTGDAVLIRVAERLRSVVRPSDAVGRLGGDEFVVVCEDIGTTREAVLLGERILAVLTQPFRVGGSAYQLSASIGVAVLEAGASASEVLVQADLAMYDAKRAGGNQVATYDKRLLQERQAFAATEQGLRRALSNGEFVIHYQPIFAMAGNLAGCEALIRWQDPEQGLRPPADFLPVAEQSGMLDEIGEVVLRTVVSQLATWRRDLPHAKTLIASVNMGVRQLVNSDFAAHVLSLLDDAHIPRDRLCLEITESEVMTDPERAIGVLTTLRAAGLGISIDDFGTGFSSLSYLQRLPATLLKIDMSFVRALRPGSRDSAVVGHVIRLAHDLGIAALVEGVETRVQMAEAQRLDCDLAQGFLLGRPAPADRTIWLTEPADQSPVLPDR